MCGRFALFEEPEVLEEMFGLVMPSLLPRYDIRPTEPVLVIRENHADLMRWGLVPYWEKSSRPAYTTFNARVEDAAAKPAFRGPFARGQRCVIPANGFFEWKGDPGHKRKYFFKNKTGLLLMAGLWDKKKTEKGELFSCTILTTEANDLVRPIHEKNRMPVILEPSDVKPWIDPAQPSENLRALFAPRESERMEMYEVDAKLRDETPALVEKLGGLFD